MKKLFFDSSLALTFYFAIYSKFLQTNVVFLYQVSVLIRRAWAVV